MFAATLDELRTKKILISDIYKKVLAYFLPHNAVNRRLAQSKIYFEFL